MRGNGDPLVRRFIGLQNHVASDLVNLPVSPTSAEEISKLDAGDVTWQFSRDGDDLVPY